mgnify:CR=1 FL=1
MRFGHIPCRSNQQVTYKETTMQKTPTKQPPKFRNVAVLLEDHARLHTLAEEEQRSMARQLSVLIRKAYDDGAKDDT